LLIKGIRPGYTRPRVAPYMHTLLYHIPFFVKMQGCFKKFTSQGVEKSNDEAKRVLFNMSNKWDAAKDILSTESREWDFKHHERMKGQYTKKSWSIGILKSVKLGHRKWPAVRTSLIQSTMMKFPLLR